MSAKLGVPEDVFLRDYARKLGSRWSLKEVPSTVDHRVGNDCILLDRQGVPGKALCKVYQDRPNQCKSWPFWDQNLVSHKAWEQAKNSVPCPGMGHGPLIPAGKILEALMSERQSSKDSAW